MNIFIYGYLKYSESMSYLDAYADTHICFTYKYLRYDSFVLRFLYEHPCIIGYAYSYMNARCAKVCSYSMVPWSSRSTWILYSKQARRFCLVRYGVHSYMIFVLYHTYYLYYTSLSIPSPLSSLSSLNNIHTQDRAGQQTKRGTLTRTHI